MPKCLEGRIALGGLAVVALWLFFGLPLYEHDAFGLEHLPHWLVAIFTGTLWWSTHKLWTATRDAAARQVKDTEILQRAYISVKPDGVRTNSSGQYIGHVIFHNVGHLPAKEVSWTVVRIVPNTDGEWRPPSVADSPFEGNNWLPIDAEMTRGSGGILQADIYAALPSPTPSPPPPIYLYVFGRVTYLDGFGQRRFSDFCHRYNYDVRAPKPGGGAQIAAEYARYHEHGNDGD